jgi:hypothetical protein
MRIVALGCILILLHSVVLAQAKQETLSFTSPRPIRDAIVQYEKEYGWIVTYEDPRLEFSGDMDDLTQRARLLGKKIDSEKPFRIPRTRTLSVTYERPTDAGDGAMQLRAVQRLLDAYGRIDGSTFELRRSTGRLHIVPGLARDAAGRLQRSSVILDTPIRIAGAPRDGMQFLAAFCEQLSNAAGTQVKIGTVPLNSLFRYQTKTGFRDSTAREILEKFLNGMPNGQRYSWRLLYGESPSGFGYVLNVNWVRDSKPATSASVRKTANDSQRQRNKGIRVLSAYPSSAVSANGTPATALRTPW